MVASCRAPSPSSQKAKPALETIQALKSLLASLPSLKPVFVREAVSSLKERHVAIPWPSGCDDLSQVQWKLAFKAPSKIIEVGSWPLQAAIRNRGSERSWNIDLSVQMPSVSFPCFINHDSFSFSDRIFSKKKTSRTIATFANVRTI